MKEAVVEGKRVMAAQMGIPETEFSFDMEKVLENIQNRGGVATTNDYSLSITAPDLDNKKTDSLGRDSTYLTRIKEGNLGSIPVADAKALYGILKNGIHLPKELFTRVTTPELGMNFKSSPESGYQLTASPSEIAPLELEYWDYADLALTKLFEYLYCIQLDDKGMLIPSYNMFNILVRSSAKDTDFYSACFSKPKMSDSSSSFNLRQFVVKVFFEDYQDHYSFESQYQDLL